MRENPYYYKKHSVLLLIIFPVLGFAQRTSFKLDTLSPPFKVQVRIYGNEEMKETNIKSQFIFYDSTGNGKVKFVYYFKYLPPLSASQSPSFVPIYQDWEDRNNSLYLWNDVMKGDFDYDKAYKFVFQNKKRNNANYYKKQILDTSRIMIAAQAEYKKKFNALIAKDYSTFAQSLHPAELKLRSYEAKAEKLRTMYEKSQFQFTSYTIDSVAKPRYYCGEIQLVIFCTNKYQLGKTQGSLTSYVVAHSFDNGANWFFGEISRFNFSTYYDMSKGSLDETPIDYALISGLNFDK